MSFADPTRTGYGKSGSLDYPQTVTVLKKRNASTPRSLLSSKTQQPDIVRPHRQFDDSDTGRIHDNIRHRFGVAGGRRL